MKTLEIAFVITGLTVGIASAQEIETKSAAVEKLKKEEVPTTVIASVEEDFPAGVVTKYARIPDREYKDE